MSFYAHSSPNLSQPPPDGWQLLHEHLRAVAHGVQHLAEEMCVDIPQLAETAHAAGLLHDLGKYRTEFQLPRGRRKFNGLDPEIKAELA